MRLIKKLYCLIVGHDYTILSIPINGPVNLECNRCISRRIINDIR